MTTKNEKQKNWKQSITVKLIVVACLSFMLLIPSALIRSLINEREGRKNGTINEITSKWGGNQTICGPVLLVPYITYTKYTNGKISKTINYFQIMPDSLQVNGNLDTEKRHRSIYEVLTYSGKFTLSGSFNISALKDWPVSFDKILWDESKIVVGISDLKGITTAVDANWNNKDKKFYPGISACTMFHNGINTPVEVNPNSSSIFNITLDLNGSAALFVSTIGNETKVNLAANWGTPGFDGTFLPSSKKVTESNFVATWNTSELNRPYPQVFTTDKYSSYTDYQNVGVQLLIPVDAYQKSTRSVKYALLFITLTFLIMFFSEIIGKSRVHPIQYLIVGIALVIFYSFLIALAEYIAFNIAFIIASTVIITMITAYTHSLFKIKKTTLSICILLILLYGYLFTIIQVADYALIIGNIGLIIVLAVVMVFSRKIDWYGTQEQNTPLENQSAE